MKGYKGFDKDLKCKEFQYEVGKEFIKSLPNFNADIFYECTGIRV